MAKSLLIAVTIIITGCNGGSSAGGGVPNDSKESLWTSESIIEHQNECTLASQDAFGVKKAATVCVCFFEGISKLYTEDEYIQNSISISQSFLESNDGQKCLELADLGSWAVEQILEVKENCVEAAYNTNPNIIKEKYAVVCACLVEDASKRWTYSDFAAYEYQYSQEQKDDGTFEECTAGIDSIEADWGASSPTISPSAFSDGETYDTEDNIIYFSWTPGDEDVIYNYTLHIFKDFYCEGVSQNIESLYGSSTQFEGVEEETYSFQVRSFHTDGSSVVSECSNHLTIHTINPTSNSIRINGTDIYTNSTLTLLTLESTNADKMYITNVAGCETGGVWETFNSTKAWTINNQNATNTVYVKFKTNPLNESECISDSIVHDNLAPLNTSFSINSGDLNTPSANVTLNLISDDATHIYATNVAGCESGGMWQSFTNSLNWTLQEEDSEISTAYIMFRDAAGNYSECLTDSITLSWSTANLSQARSAMAANVIGLKAYFAGGSDSSKSNALDVFNSADNTWSNTTIPRALSHASSTVLENRYILYAGGNSSDDPEYSNIVDIYDTEENNWSVSYISLARHGVGSTSIGSVAFIAGGAYDSGMTWAATNLVDKYNITTDTWEVDHLSESRASVVATSIGTIAIFAGGSTPNGYSDTVDIYNSITDSWTQSNLSQARHSLVAATSGTKAIFAGGYGASGFSNVVDIYDSETNSWITSSLSTARTQSAIAVLGAKVYIGGGVDVTTYSDVVDIYDLDSNSWTTTNLSIARVGLSAVNVSEKILFVGGWNNGNASSVVDNIYIPLSP